MTVGLVLLSASTLLVARSLGVGPDENAARLEGRARFCEALALSSSTLVNSHDLKTLEASLNAFVRRYPDVESVGLRQKDQRLIMQVGDHQNRWSVEGEPKNGSSQVLVPLVAEGGEWGAVEVCFQPLARSGPAGLLMDGSVHLILLALAGNSVIFFLFLKKALQYLDPSRVVPERVRNALNTIVGGLVILDNQERIVLANTAFGGVVGQTPSALVGRLLSRFPWVFEADNASPWRESLQNGVTHSGATVRLGKCDHDRHENEHRSYIVNTSPIVSQDGKQQGALVSFEDVTELEKKKSELSRALEVLKASRDEIRKQNEELRRLATRDPLTDCLNRRSFYEILEAQCASARRYGHSLCCVMLDVDRFKSVNDKHGHSTGDLVLRKVAAALIRSVRQSDYVCRYGGEEFCVLLPHQTMDEAAEAAERYRKAVEELHLPNIPITASFGVSQLADETSGPQEMLDQADKCLYVAKRNGRNQVVRWDEAADDAEIDSLAAPRTNPEAPSPDPHIEDRYSSEIPFHAVSALLSALAYRDLETAEHSRRVADLCVIGANGMMTARKCYILEIAALLHDIGKIGVPDSILLKPGPLTEDEWKSMRDHDRAGVEIISSAFSCPPLTEIIQHHHTWYHGDAADPDLPTGKDIPLGARILSIADAYDAIVSDRVYRKGRTQKEAFAELRRCKVRQFDPDLVEHFIQGVSARYESRTATRPDLSRQQALLFGQQMERLADAIDNQDVETLGRLADGISQTAHQCGELRLARAAGDVGAAVDAEAELTEIVTLTNELMALCRDTQTAFLDRLSVDGVRKPPPRNAAAGMTLTTAP